MIIDDEGINKSIDHDLYILVDMTIERKFSLYESLIDTVKNNLLKFCIKKNFDRCMLHCICVMIMKSIIQVRHNSGDLDEIALDSDFEAMVKYINHGVSYEGRIFRPQEGIKIDFLQRIKYKETEEQAIFNLLEQGDHPISKESSIKKKSFSTMMNIDPYDFNHRSQPITIPVFQSLKTIELFRLQEGHPISKESSFNKKSFSRSQPITISVFQSLKTIESAYVDLFMISRSFKSNK